MIMGAIIITGAIILIVLPVSSWLSELSDKQIFLLHLQHLINKQTANHSYK